MGLLASLRRSLCIAVTAAVAALGCGGMVEELSEPLSTHDDASAPHAPDGTVGDATSDATVVDAEGPDVWSDTSVDSTVDTGGGGDAGVEDAALDATDATFDAGVDACISPGCNETTVTTTIYQVTGLAADDGAVYWHDGDLRSVSVDGGPATDLVANVPCDGTFLGGPGYLYWISAGRVAVTAKQKGGGVGFLAYTSNAVDLSLDPQGLWILKAADPPYLSELWNWAVPSLPLTPPTGQLYFPDLITHVTTNGQFVFQYLAVNRSLFLWNEQTRFASIPAMVPSLAAWVADADNLYWLTANGDLMAMPAATWTAGHLVASGHSSVCDPLAIAVDSTGLYWIDRGLWALPAGASTPVLLSPVTDVAALIAVNAGYVFFVVGDTGPGPGPQRLIVRVPKP